jgi:hypothetical protein
MLHLARKMPFYPLPPASVASTSNSTASLVLGPAIHNLGITPRICRVLLRTLPTAGVWDYDGPAGALGLYQLQVASRWIKNVPRSKSSHPRPHMWRINLLGARTSPRPMPVILHEFPNLNPMREH